jgi:hypothetical protein
LAFTSFDVIGETATAFEDFFENTFDSDFKPGLFGLGANPEEGP